MGYTFSIEQMIEPNESERLIRPLLNGDKLKILGKEFVSGIQNYFEKFENQFLTLDEICVSNLEEFIKHPKFHSLVEKFNPEFTANLNVPFANYLSNLKESLNKDSSEAKGEILNYSSQCELSLHDFQDRMRRKAISLFSEGQNKMLIQMPTGSGKTRTACEIIIDFIRSQSTKSLLNERFYILWVAQSFELCSQASETFKYLYDKKGTTNIGIGHYYGDNNIDESILEHSAIIFCSVQKLLNGYKENLWEEIKDQNQLVVVDEAHRSVANRWVEALSYFTSNYGCSLIGLTATPGSSSDDTTYKIKQFYNGVKYSLLDKEYSEITNPISFLVEKKFLANVIKHEIESYSVIENAVENSNQDELKFKKATLNKLTVDASRNKLIVDIIKDHSLKGQKILIFSCGLKHSRILKYILSKSDVYSECIDQQTKNREYIIDQFKNGDLNILINFGVLTTGFDAPKTDVCVIARPVESIVMYSQMVGRILRGAKNIKDWNSKDNKTNFLYTVKDNFNHGDYDDLYNSFNKFWK